jgi:hypothetical protein
VRFRSSVCRANSRRASAVEDVGTSTSQICAAQLREGCALPDRRVQFDHDADDLASRQRSNFRVAGLISRNLTEHGHFARAGPFCDEGRADPEIAKRVLVEMNRVLLFRVRRWRTARRLRLLLRAWAGATPVSNCCKKPMSTSVERVPICFANCPPPSFLSP